MTKLLYCSWCNEKTFLPISTKIVRCVNCGELKSIDINDDLKGTIFDSN